MALSLSATTTTTTVAIVSVILLLILPTSYCSEFIPDYDLDVIEFALNLEYLETEFFLSGALGRGLDSIAPSLAAGGPRPIGGRQAKLDPFLKDVILQFGLQEVGHLRAIKSIVKGFPRPLLNISAGVFAEAMNTVFGRRLVPPFNPYDNGLNFLIASYVIPYVGLTGYVGANPNLQSATAKRLVAGLLGVEAGQDAVIRTLLYSRVQEKVYPYGITVAEFTDRISKLRDRLARDGLNDEGLIVPQAEGAEGKISGNVLSADQNSLSYARTPAEILRIVYGTGDEHVPGGFYPRGADGRIAKSYLRIHGA
ncbi:hypothetical protein ACSBR1_032086 [Camellia fascicularis]